jgi:hypothetical protein
MDGMSLDNRHKWALPYWARPGIRLIKKGDDDGTGAGGGGDEEDDDDDEDEDDDDDPDEGKSEEELRAELKAVRKSLSKANGSSAKRRAHAKRLEAELEEARKGKGKKKTDDDDDELDVEAIRAQARSEGEKAGNDRIKLAEVKAALAAAGITDAKTRTRLARMVDLGDLDLDDDGEVDGIDDAIDTLREDLPALFEKPRRKRESVAGGSDRSGAGGGASKAKSASERQAEGLLGRGR